MSIDKSATNEQKVNITKNLMIPKHRFDMVNLALKDTRQELKEKAVLVDGLDKLVEVLKKQLLDAIVEKVLAQYDAKNLVATKALINYSKLSLQDDGDIVGLTEQLEKIRINNDYLFEQKENTGYMLLPMDSELLKKLTTKHINQKSNQSKTKRSNTK